MMSAPSDGGLQLTSTGAEKLDWVARTLNGGVGKGEAIVLYIIVDHKIIRIQS